MHYNCDCVLAVLLPVVVPVEQDDEEGQLEVVGRPDAVLVRALLLRDHQLQRQDEHAITL